MNSRSLRRLAADHGSLHNSPLPPNYLFDLSNTPNSDLTTLDILLAGPTSTPYDSGVFKLHLTIPSTYPSEPPKAFFRTKIFHPNVDDATGAVCVETLKRDWDVKLTLRDVLVTISCLLVQPNASSALNADAGMLLEQGEGGWEAFEKRARLMTRVHAGIASELRDVVREAQRRGDTDEDRKDSGTEAEVKGRKRRRGLLQRDTEELPMEAKRRAETPPQEIPRVVSKPFVLQSGIEDVFGGIRLPAPSTRPPVPSPDFSSLFLEPTTTATPQMFPSMYKGDISTSESEISEEYPPSPKKSPKKHATTSPNTSYEYPASPKKSPKKRMEFGQAPPPTLHRAESSRTAAERMFFTPAIQQQQQTPVFDSTFLDQSTGFEGLQEGDTDVDVSFEVQTRRLRDRRLVREVRNRVPRLVKGRKSRVVTPVDTGGGTSEVGESSWLGGEVLGRMPLGELKLDRSLRDEVDQTFEDEWRQQQEAEGNEWQQQEQEEMDTEWEMQEIQAQEEEKRLQKEKENKALEKKLWKRCAGDVDRWNRGDFGGFFVSGGRW